MNRWALPVLALLVAPFAVADVQYSGSYETYDAHVPQMHCEFVQTRPHGATDPMRCEVTGRLQEAMAFRIRMAGAGRLYTFLYDENTKTQVGQVECTSVTTKTCFKQFSTFGYYGSRVTLRAFLDGPGGAAATLTVEKVQYSLP